MGRPTNKAELLSAAQSQYTKLGYLLESMSEDELTGLLKYRADSNQKEAHWARDQNIRDVLVHLYQWQEMLLDWVEANRAGNSQPFLPEPYNWRNYAALNDVIRENHQEISVVEAMELLQKSHDLVIKLIESFTDQELFEKAYFDWTGTTSLGAYCISSSSSHYEWAIKKIKAYLREARSS